MQVTVIGRHMEVPAETKRYMQEKAEKLPHYYDRVMAVQVVVDAEQAASKRVEVVVSVAGHEDFVAEERGADIFSCFDLCMGHVEKQLTRFKDRIRDRKHHARAGQGEE